MERRNLAHKVTGDMHNNKDFSEPCDEHELFEEDDTAMSSYQDTCFPEVKTANGQ